MEHKEDTFKGYKNFSKDRTLKLYQGFYHEIFNEPQREQVFKDVEAWLAAHA